MQSSLKQLLQFGAFALCLALPLPVKAHFIWLVPQTNDGKTRVQVFFGEGAYPDDPDLLKPLHGLKVYQVRKDGTPHELSATLKDGELFAEAEGVADSLFVATHDYGVITRGNAQFRLNYYAKSGPAIDNPIWRDTDCGKQLQFLLIPAVEGDAIRVRAMFNGAPAEGSEVHAHGPGLDALTVTTGAEGEATIKLADPGLYSIRARHIENAAGMVNGQQYSSVRHYTTIAVEVPNRQASNSLPAFPQPVTSFGAAMIGDKLYTYGGHTGEAHAYSSEGHDRFLRQLDLTKGTWEVLGEGPGLQGLALVAHGGKLIRLGGFTAKNAPGADQDLWSLSDVVQFDSATKAWTDQPALPEPRSSFDAAVLEDTIYVVGGWNMAGAAEAVWHETAWALDLTREPLEWKPIARAPFQRRALSVAAHDGSIFAIGGMQREGGITTRVDVYDPRTDAWTRGPSLIGKPSVDADDEGSTSRRNTDMTGFGSSAFATGGRLYVSTIQGQLQRLKADGSAWEIVQKTPTARFFHRMVPIDERRLLIVGGANMQSGKFEEVEILDISTP